MRATIALLLLLVATPAHAVKSIAFVGDSINWGGLTVTPSNAYKRSPHNAARTLFSLLKKAPGGNQWLNATVVDWSVSSADPSDWTTAPDATLCTNYRAKYPHLEAACRDNAPILNYIGSGYDLVAVAFTGSTTPSASAWVDTLETLEAALDPANGTILLGTSPWGASSGTTAMPADSFRSVRVAVESEMSGRGIINGANGDKGTLPMSIDTIHARDHGYATQGALWYGALP